MNSGVQDGAAGHACAASRRWRGRAIQWLIPIYAFLIAGISTVASVAPIVVVRNAPLRCALAVMAPFTFTLSYVLVAGGLSRLTLRAMVPGKFPRDLQHPVYGPRRLYGVCWTAIYYFPLLYHAVLATPALKGLTFRLFGYRGSLDFATYPDTWLRDLPLVTLGAGSYLSNKATISPNMCLNNGKILVAPVSIGAHSMVGHGTLIAPGVSIGQGSEIGVSGDIGVGVRIGDHSSVGHVVSLDHGAVIGSHCDIGSRAYVGQKTTIHDGVRIPPGAVIPGKLILRTQADVTLLLEVRTPPAIIHASSAHPVFSTAPMFLPE